MQRKRNMQKIDFSTCSAWWPLAPTYLDLQNETVTD